MRAEITLVKLFSDKDELRMREAVLEAKIEDLLDQAKTFAATVEQRVRQATAKEVQSQRSHFLPS